MGSPLSAFQWAHDEHRTLSLSPPHPKGLKNAVSKIWTIIIIIIIKSICNYPCKNDWCFYVKFCVKLKSPIFDLFSLVAPQP